MLVTGVFYAIWGICMPLSIRQLRLIEIVIFGVEIIFFLIKAVPQNKKKMSYAL